MGSIVILNEITVIEKIINIFHRFPFINDVEVENYVKTLENNLFKKNSLSLLIPHFSDVDVRSINISCGIIGDFSKSVSIGGHNPHEIYSCQFIPFDSVHKIISLHFLGKNITNEICSKIIPFIVTAGRDKSNLPLLINTFPKLAHFLLQY